MWRQTSWRCISREPINIGSIVLVCVTAAVILLLILFVQFVKRRMSAAQGSQIASSLTQGRRQYEFA